MPKFGNVQVNHKMCHIINYALNNLWLNSFLSFEFYGAATIVLAILRLVFILKV